MFKLSSTTNCYASHNEVVQAATLAIALLLLLVQVAVFDCNPPAQQSCAGLRSKIATSEAGSR